MSRVGSRRSVPTTIIRPRIVPFLTFRKPERVASMTGAASRALRSPDPRPMSPERAFPAPPPILQPITPERALRSPTPTPPIQWAVRALPWLHRLEARNACPFLALISPRRAPLLRKVSWEL